MKVPVALALPNGLAVTEIEMIDEVLTLTVVSIQSCPCCPLCGVSASRVHSHYTRKLTDLPCGGQHVCLLVCVRKLFCEISTCASKIFAERLTPFAQPWARVIRRLYQIVQVLGLTTGGRLGVRVTDRLGIQTCRTTILRRIMALPTEPVGKVPELGIDDFAFRRGRKYGTILVDMVSHKVVDLLSNRTVETSAAWMDSHLEITLRAQGFKGSYRVVHRFLKTLPEYVKQRVDNVELSKTIPKHPLHDFQSQKAVWWFMRDSHDLEETEQSTLQVLLQACPTASTLYRLTQEFLSLLRQRKGELLDAWIEKVKESQINELCRLVNSIERDKAAVLAGLTLHQNNGLVEGKVNKLKLIKRMGYGRAEFSLLRQRVLHAL